jgi:predicted amidohydrolase
MPPGQKDSFFLASFKQLDQGYSMRINSISLACTALAAGAGLVACGGGDDDIVVFDGVVIRNAAIVSTADGWVTTGKTIILANGKITAITNDGVQVAGTAQSVDAAGKFVIPGFLDMHSYAMDKAGEAVKPWPLLIANGVTGIRQMDGSAAMIAQARQLNLDSAAHRVDAPEILAIPSDIFTGLQGQTAAAGAAFVDQKLADGADFIKVVGGNRDAVLGVLAQAKAKGNYVAGHSVPALAAGDAVDAGWRVLEHLGANFGFMLDCSTEVGTLRQTLTTKPPYTPPITEPARLAAYLLNPRALDGAAYVPIFQKILDTYDANACGALVSKYAAAGTWYVPSLIRLRTQNYGNDPAYVQSAQLKYVDKTTRAIYAGTGPAFSAQGAGVVSTLAAFYQLEEKLVKALDASGAPMLAGSDEGTQVVGFALQDEFRVLAAAGLSPLKILQMTTVNGAKFLNREATMGSVDIGKNADLVLLDANPVTDVANFSKIWSVVLKGKVFTAADLEKLKADVAAAYAN